MTDELQQRRDAHLASLLKPQPVDIRELEKVLREQREAEEAVERILGELNRVHVLCLHPTSKLRDRIRSVEFRLEELREEILEIAAEIRRRTEEPE